MIPADSLMKYWRVHNICGTTPTFTNIPDAVPGESKSKSSVNGGGGGGQGAGQGAGQGSSTLPPPPPRVPIDVLRGWQLAVKNAALAQGDRALPQAGLVYFPYRGKVTSIRSMELIYEGTAGTASLTLQ